MSAKTKKTPEYPSWYYRHSKPYIPEEPQQYITSHKTINRTQIWDGDELVVESGKRYSLSTERDYYNDGPDEFFLVEFEEVVIENPNYAQQVKDREEQIKRLAKWNKITLEHEKREKEEADKRERALYDKLKKKYEK